jgi:hypothetical protein
MSTASFSLPFPLAGDRAFYGQTQHGSARLAWPLLFGCLFLPHVATAQAERVSVATYISNAKFAAYEKVAKARAEELLADSNYVVLDEAKAKQLKRGWVNLADAGHVITAEEFVQRAGKYDISKVLRLSINVNVKPVLGLFHTATASADFRWVDKAARVKSFTLTGMGAPGTAPSDGLTESAAVANAILRAVDGAALKAGLVVLSPATPKGVPLTLEPATLPAKGLEAQPDPGFTDAKNAPEWARAAKLVAETWRGETPACVAVSPDGQVGALGGYTWAIDRLGGIKRSYGGRVHLINVQAKEEFNLYTVHPLGERDSGENSSSSPLACTFVGNWRYLVVATGNVLSCFDVERGVETCRLALPDGADKAQLSVARQGASIYVVLKSDKKQTAFKVAVQGPKSK